MGHLPAGWISLEPHLAGVLAVAIAATVSLVCIAALVSFIALLLSRFYSHSNESERREKRMSNKAIRFLASTHGLLFIDLLLGDLLQAIGFVLNYSWFHHRGLPPSENPTALCTTQGVLIQVGDTASAFSSLIISVNLFFVIVFSRHPSIKALWFVIAFQWLVVGILAAIGPRWLEREGMPFYADAGSWCWISSHYSDARLWLHYFFVFVIAFVDLVLYTIIAAYLALQSRRTSAKIPLNISNLSGVAKIMPLYALGYIVTILPLSAYRAASMAGHHWSPDAQLAAGFVFTLSGAVNCVIYATTRNLISSESVGALRRTSQSATGGGGGGGAASGTGGGWGPGPPRGGRIRNFFFPTKKLNRDQGSNGPEGREGRRRGRGGRGGGDSGRGGVGANHHHNSSTGIRVQVETQVYLPGYHSAAGHDGADALSTFNDDDDDDDEEGPGRLGRERVGGSKKGRLEYERDRMRDWEREREMARDRALSARREGDFDDGERPFASLREIELSEEPQSRSTPPPASSSTTTRRSSDDSTMKDSYDV
ncbi:hypothetical protein JCM11491_005095 [Sporobolomyces phaffii]